MISMVSTSHNFSFVRLITDYSLFQLQLEKKSQMLKILIKISDHFS